MTHRKFIALALLAGSMALGGHALAQDPARPDPGTAPKVTTPSAKPPSAITPTAKTPSTTKPGSGEVAMGMLSITDVITKLSGIGYADFRAVERKSDDRYDVKARDADGRNVELHVDSRTGEVVNSKRD